MKVSFRNAMAFTLLVLTILPIVVLGFLSYKKAESMLVEEIKNSNLKTMENAKTFLMNSYIEEMEKGMRILSGNTCLREVLEDPRVVESPMEEWKQFIGYHSHIFQIYLGTEEGNIYMVPYWNPPDSYDPRTRPWYRAALTNPGSVVWSRPYRDVVTNQTIVSAALTIKNTDSLVGVLAMDISPDWFLTLLKNMDFGTGSYGVILDGSGNIIAHEYQSMVGGSVNDEEWFEELSRQDKGSTLYFLDGKETFISYVTIPQTGWKLVSFIPKVALESRVRPIRNRTIYTALFSLLIVVFINILVLRVFTVKTNELINSMSEVEKGNFNIRVRYGFFEEFKLLGNKFNNMVITIQRLIEERKRAEGQLEYTAVHDSLTKAYNRVYFEREIQRFEKDCSNAGIILCDIDGLKIVNNTLGYEKGDELLKGVASLIEESVPERAVLCRIGGDEFAVLIEDSRDMDLEDICSKVKKKFREYDKSGISFALSVSTGFAKRISHSTSMKKLFKEADNYMYKEKLHSSHSVCSAIVKTLSKALEARDFITEGHADRLQFLVDRLAREIGLSERRIGDLRLLAQFHDIGKVGISDSILFKPGPLTEKEMKEMQRHSEIGYRIAVSSSQLNHIADWILKHHEWWNGQGYPIGLKGEDIPLECRILSILDAYDAMTNDRPYRKAMSHIQAVKQLKKESGTKFDPKLIDIFIGIVNNELGA